jgi:hypothetical protein
MHNWSNNANNQAYDSYGIEDFADDFITPTKHTHDWDSPSRRFNHHSSRPNMYHPATETHNPQRHDRGYRHAQTAQQALRDRLSYNAIPMRRSNHHMQEADYPVKNFDEIFDDISQRFDSVTGPRRTAKNNFFDQEQNLQAYGISDIPIRRKPAYAKRRNKHQARRNLRQRFDQLETDLNASFDNFATKLRPVRPFFNLAYFNFDID